VIKIEGVYKNFGEKEVLRGVDAEIKSGEFFTIIGPSGQGKSTLLRLINMLDAPTSGRILFDGVDIHAEKKQAMEIRRRMGMVFQKPVAFNASVYENIASGLRYRGTEKGEIRETVESALEEISLPGYSERKARTLSGGEMQRVALARVMVTRPDLLLLDEPTANLDPVSTSKIEELLLHLHREYGTTIIMSTHDMLQGQRLADRIAVMMEGRFSQIGTPREVFSAPANRYVAEFVGIDNIIGGEIIRKEGGIAHIDVSGIEVEALTTIERGVHVCWCIRPEDVTIHLSHAKRISALNVLTGTIREMSPQGPLNKVVIDCGFDISVLVTWKSSEQLRLNIGDEVRVSFKASSIHVMEEPQL